MWVCAIRQEAMSASYVSRACLMRSTASDLDVPAGLKMTIRSWRRASDQPTLRVSSAWRLVVATEEET